MGAISSLPAAPADFSRFAGGCFVETSSGFFLGLPGFRFTTTGFSSFFVVSFFPFLPAALSSFFFLDGGCLAFLSGCGEAAGIFPAAISFFSCSYAAAASSPSF